MCKLGVLTLPPPLIVRRQVSVTSTSAALIVRPVETVGKQGPPPILNTLAVNVVFAPVKTYSPVEAAPLMFSVPTDRLVSMFDTLREVPLLKSASSVAWGVEN